MFQRIKNSKRPQVLWTGLAIFAVACGGGSALSGKLDGGQTSANLGLKVQASSTTVAAALSKALLETSVDAQKLSVTAGKACVEEIKIKLPEGVACADAGFVTGDNIKCEVEEETEEGVTVAQTEIKVTGPILFDLITGESTPALSTLAFPSGAYRKIEFKFGGACDLGAETSITLQGTMKDGSAVDHAFDMALEYDEDLKIESPTDIQVLEGQVNGVFANLVLDNWFADIDFAGCIDDNDLVANVSGVIEINKDTVATGACDNIYQDVMDGIKNAMEFEDSDHDDDGIDDSEDSSDDSSDDLVKR